MSAPLSRRGTAPLDPGHPAEVKQGPGRTLLGVLFMQ